MITIHNLRNNFGTQTAVDIENYTINQGEMVGLVGNNGAGKTTLFRLMLDLLKADTGEIIINDIHVNQSEDWKSFTGAFIDDGFLISYLTPEEYFYFIGKMYGLKKEEVDERLIPFERFMNGEVLGQKKFIRNFSAGNKQKIGIVSAMLHYPKLIILDEPTAGQDIRHYNDNKEFLRRLNEQGVTVMMITHDMHLMLEYTQRALVFCDGELSADRSAAGVLCDPALIEQAALKETSLYTLANRCGIEPAQEFVERFIAQDREVRENGR